MSLAEIAVMLYRTLPPMPTLGLSTTSHLLPVQCPTRLWLMPSESYEPTDQMLFGDRAAMPLSSVRQSPTYRLSVGCQVCQQLGGVVGVEVGVPVGERVGPPGVIEGVRVGVKLAGLVGTGRGTLP